MKTCESRLKKTMVFFRKSMCAFFGGIWILGAVCTGAPVSDVAVHHPHDNSALTDEEIVSWADKGCVKCQANRDAALQRMAVPEHRCPSKDEVKSMVRGGAVERELKRGADAGCARCKANLNWFNKHNHYHRADAVQHIELSEHCKSNHDGMIDAAIVEWADKGCETCKSHRALAAHRMGSHDGLSDAAIVEWADKGCVKCQANRGAALQRMAVPEHRCPSNDEVKCMVRGSATEGELKRGADAGCARCKANLNWLNKHNRYHSADAVQRIELSEHCKSNHDGLSDAAIVEWADKGCVKCQTNRDAALQRMAVPEHRCPSNDEVKCMVRGSATEGELKRGADAGCARCKANLNWFNKYDR